jgi:predicted PurR-regulated permease PerM
MKISDIEISPIKVSIILLGILVAYFIGDFANSILAAFVIYVLSRRFLLHMVEKKKFNATLASLIIILITFVVFLLPLVLISLLLSSKINYIVNNYSTFLNTIHDQLQVFLDKYGIELNTSDILQKTAGYITKYAPNLLNATANTVTQLVIMYFTLYYMLKENLKFEKWVLSFSPFSLTKTHLLIVELKNNIYGSSIGIPVLGIVQAIIALIGYLIFGVEQPFLWAILTGLFSVVPIVGTTIIWLPVSLYLIITGDPLQGSGLLIYSILIITNIDNVVRFLLLKKYGDIHPLITIFGLILGIRLFGFLGIILGPLVLSYLFLLIKFYKKDEEIVNVNIGESNNN